MEEKSNLDKAIAWIYDRVLEDPGTLAHHFESVAGVGPYYFAGYTALVFTFQGKSHSMRSEELMATPDHAHWVLRDLAANLGVRIRPEFYQFPGVPPEQVDPIGEPWPEKSTPTREVYHVGRQGIQDIYDGMPWVAKLTNQHPAGMYYAQSGRSWWSQYWMWVRQL